MYVCTHDAWYSTSCISLSLNVTRFAMAKESGTLTLRELALPGRTLPPALPLIISRQDRWDPDSCKLVTTQQDGQNHGLQLVEEALELLRTIDKPLAVLSICGPYRSGKSYFMSRLLGRPETFQLGHSMRACTRGIWMATAVIECEEFAIVLLDTEGIDAIGASETMAMSLLTLTTLLSSYLIYNSKKVPQKVDLDKMRCFTQLSTSLLAQRGDSMSTDGMKKFFPHFLWLLRDVALDVTNKRGELISPTEFLHTRVLASASGQLTDLGRSLCGLFPSLVCHTIPTPAIKPKLIRNIVELQDQLTPAFNTAIDESIRHILQHVMPKKAIDGVSVVDGPALAALARGYVDAINIPGALPDLEQGWMAVIKLQLKEHSDKLVAEYEREMEASLQGNLPMEESNLTRLHQQTLNRKRESLQQETRRLDPLSIICGDSESVQSRLEQVIVQRSAEGKVVGGVLFQFTTQNYSTSKHQCEVVFKELVESSGIHKKCNTAFMESQPLDIRHQIQEIDEAYASQAVGPATDEVLEKGHVELNALGDLLKQIPGPPQDVKIIGTGSDRLKLGWEPPLQNPRAVESYVVWKRKEGNAWEKVRETKRTKTLITGLKSNTSYEFRVIASNDLIKSIEATKNSVTKKSQAALVAEGIAIKAVAKSSIRIASTLPAVAGYVSHLMQCYDSSNQCFGAAKFVRRHDKVFIVATLPVSIVFAPITAAVFAGTVVHYRLRLHGKNEGDLSPESDSEL